MKKYDAYKDSGIEWIGEIPEHWKVSYYKHVCEIQNGFPFKSQLFSNEKGMPLLRIRDITSGNIETYYTGDYSEDYVVDNGSLLVGMDGDFNIRWWVKGKALLNQRCCNVIEKGNIELRFLYYLLPFDLEIINDLTYYTTVKHLSNGDINNSKICIPSLSEQKSITSFLDHKTTQIDTLIEKKEQLVEKLTLKRQAIINEAVTKGLNPDVPMKDSGIEWLGEIPEHWDMKKLKYFAKIRNGKDQKEVLIDEGGYPVLGTGGEFGRATSFLYDKSSVLLGRKGTINNPLFIEEPFWTVDTLFYTEIKEDIFPKYFFYLCKTIHFDFYQESSAVPSMTQDNLNNILLCWTYYNEQVEIADYIDRKMEKIDSLIEKVSDSINKLKLYRQSLISEAVTGKIDLRDWKQPSD